MNNKEALSLIKSYFDNSQFFDSSLTNGNENNSLLLFKAIEKDNLEIALTSYLEDKILDIIKADTRQVRFNFQVLNNNIIRELTEEELFYLSEKYLYGGGSYYCYKGKEYSIFGLSHKEFLNELKKDFVNIKLELKIIDKELNNESNET